MNTQTQSRREFLMKTGIGAAVLCAGAVGQQSFAQALAEQLHILVGFPPGSTPDTVSRAVAEQLGASYTRSALVENRPGAAGMIAVNALKAAPSDGSVVLLAPGAVASAYPYLYQKLAYDATADLQPVSLAAEVALGLAVGPAVPTSVVTVRDFIEWMRANPKLANIGSPGVGTPPHLVEAMLFRKANVAWQHVAYPGGPPAMAALLGGQIAALILPEGILRPHLASGKLRVLGTSGATRSRYLADVATFAEQGYPELVVTDWFAFFMPRGASAAVIDATSRKLQAAIGRPELVAAYAEAGIVPASSTPAALTSRIAAERLYWQPVIRDNNIRLE
jgi:tripartite-type tricarboxylate transporter receptor subunit TctC